MSEGANGSGGLMSSAAGKGRMLTIPPAADSFVKATQEPLPAPALDPGREEEQLTGAVAPGIQKMVVSVVTGPPVYDEKGLNTMIPKWLNEEFEKTIKAHGLLKKEVVANALMDYLGVRPPHERKKGRG